MAYPYLIIHPGFIQRCPKTDAGTTRTQPWGYFYFDPNVELAAKYAFTPKVILYTGISAQIVQFTGYLSSAYKANDNADEEKNTPSAWTVDGIKVSGGNLALQLKPSAKLSVEFSLNDIISYTGTKGTFFSSKDAS